MMRRRLRPSATLTSLSSWTVRLNSSKGEKQGVQDVSPEAISELRAMPSSSQKIAINDISRAAHVEPAQMVDDLCTNNANLTSGSCRSRVLDDDEEDAKDNGDSDFINDDNQQQSLDEPSEKETSGDSDFAAEKKPKEPSRKLAARGNAARTGIYKEPSSGDEDDDDESSSGASFSP